MRVPPFDGQFSVHTTLEFKFFSQAWFGFTGHGDVRRLVLESDQISVHVDPVQVDFRVGQHLRGWFPIGSVSDNGLSRPGPSERHPGFQFVRRRQFKVSADNVNG